MGNNMTRKNKIARIAILTGSLLAAGAAVFLLWWEGRFLPGWITWENKEIAIIASAEDRNETANAHEAENGNKSENRNEADNQNEKENENGNVTDKQNGKESENRVCRLSLSRRRFSASYDEDPESLLFRTQKDWLVSDFLTGDIDKDGAREVLLLVWKHGSYGKHRPFWVERDTIRFSQHIFIYTLRDDILKPIWMSSALELSILEWELDEEGVLTITDLDGETSRWAWIRWGLKRVD